MLLVARNLCVGMNTYDPSVKNSINRDYATHGSPMSHEHPFCEEALLHSLLSDAHVTIRFTLRAGVLVARYSFRKQNLSKIGTRGTASEQLVNK